MQYLRDHQGRRIRLTDERIAHILTHPEMVGMESDIRITLANPQKVVQSSQDPNVWLYHRRYAGTRVGDKLMCVVVKTTENDSFIITAFLTDQVKRGSVLWGINK